MLPSIRIWYEADGDYSSLYAEIEDEDSGTVTLGETVDDNVTNFAL